MQQQVRRMFADSTAVHLLALTSPPADKYGFDPNSICSSSSPFPSPTTLADDSRLVADCGTRSNAFDYDDDSEDSDSKADYDTKSIGSNRHSNHSEIEKRRRDKMNSFINEIAGLVPACVNLSKKMDKLSVLRVAVQHIKSLKGSSNVDDQESYKPSSLPDETLRELFEKNSDGCIMAITFERLRIFYSSDNVRELLGWNTEELIGQSFINIVHPDDLNVVKDQIFWQGSCLVGNNLSDEKSVGFRNSSRKLQLCESTFLPGFKRAFSCRMRSKTRHRQTGEKRNKNGDCDKPEVKDHYENVICNGFVKDGAFLTQAAADSQSDSMAEELVEKCRYFLVLAINPVVKSIICDDSNKITGIAEPCEFASRHSVDGKFLHVDQNAMHILGYLPQQLVGTSYLELVHPHSTTMASDTCRQALEHCGEHTYPKACHIRTVNGIYVPVIATWLAFRNPWNEEFQFFVVRHRIALPLTSDEDSTAEQNCDVSGELAQLSPAPTSPNLPRTQIVGQTTKETDGTQSFDRLSSSAYW